ncbi:unnamed protein product [Alternaria alternata]
MKELAAANQLYKKRIAEEKRQKWVEEKAERDQIKAKKAEEVAERKVKREHADAQSYKLLHTKASLNVVL